MARINPVAKINDLINGQKAAAKALTGTIESQRTQLRTLRSERNVLQQSPVDAETVRSRIAEFLKAEEDAARNFHPGAGCFAAVNYAQTSAHRLVSGASRITVPMVGNAGPSSVTLTPPGSMIGLMCICGQREVIEAQLVAGELNLLKGQGLSVEQREAALGEIDAEMLQIEILIEKLIRAAEDAGIAVARDEDARPEIYLAMEL